MFKDVCELMAKTVIIDDIGQQIEAVNFREVYCGIHSVGQKEFFQARQSNLQSSKVFTVRTIEYANEEELRHLGRIYTIYRTYDRADEMTELYCEVRVNG